MRSNLLSSVALCLLLGVSACSSDVHVRGNLPDPETVQVIRPGIHTRDDVQSFLGSPSTISTFEDDTWYYIGERTEKFAFFEPDILERSVVVVSFDDQGYVGDTHLYTLEDGQIIDPVSRETPTEGRELTVLQQLFGNLGRFSGVPEGSPGGGAPPVPN